MSHTPSTEASRLVHTMLFGGWSKDASPTIDDDIKRWVARGAHFMMFRREVEAWGAINSEAAREAERAVATMLLLGIGRWHK